MLQSRAITALLTAICILLYGCGETVDKTGVTIDEPFTGNVCDLVGSGELSQLFTVDLEPERDAGTPLVCIWQNAEADEEVFRYTIYENAGLDSVIQQLQEQRDFGLESERVPGLGDAAAWTDAGLLVTSNNLTLQLSPRRDDVPRELYEQLARLLFERLEDAA